MNCRHGDGPTSDERRSLIAIPRFIASASQVLYVGVHAPGFVAATAGNATQAMSVPATASVIIRIVFLLFSTLKASTPQACECRVLPTSTLICVNGIAIHSRARSESSLRRGLG